MGTKTPEVNESVEKVRDERDMLHSVMHEFVEEIRKLREENKQLREKLKNEPTTGDD